jgi:hypothetical protein
MDEKRKFHYDAKTGKIDIRPFYDSDKNVKEPYIELTFDEWNEKLSCLSYGYMKTYKDGSIVEEEDTSVTASDDYKNVIKQATLDDDKKYLSDTFYIVSAITGCLADNDLDGANALRAKYKDELDKRHKAVDEIAKLEA